MDANNFEKLFYSFIDHQKAILISKANDYANNTDRLQNFKQVAGVTLSTPVDVIVQHLGNKVARLANLTKNKKTPNHESIQDTLVDLANYAILLAAAIEEEKAIEMNKLESYGGEKY